jgi:hypothetical protein
MTIKGSLNLREAKMKKQTSQYIYLKGKITGGLRALGLSEKSEPIRMGLRDVLESFIAFTDEVEGVARVGGIKTFKNVKDAKRLK